MITSKLTAKNQTTIPKAVVEALQIKPSSLLVYEIDPEGHVSLTAKSATFLELSETFPKKKRRKSATVEQIHAAVRDAASRRFKRASR